MRDLQGASTPRVMSTIRRALPRATSFWLLAVLLASLLLGASAPSPLYSIYQARWHFTSITLTEVYAVFAFGALGSLLVTGRISDHVGRRRVTGLALAILVGSMLTFVTARDVGGLFLARLVQGVGTGMATGPISAWLLDLQPSDRAGLGGVVGGVALVAGLATGALVSGMLAEYGPDPLHLVYWVLAAVFVLALLAMPMVPDVVARRPGWRRTLRPEIGVPLAARPLFVAMTPSLIATWAVCGLYLSLGPSLAVSLLHTRSHVAGGLVITALLGSAAVASYLARRSEPRSIVINGSLLLVAGVGITLVGVALGSSVGLYGGSVIAGLGVGPAFSGVLRGLTPLAPPDRRAALLAAIYITVYLSFSIPAVMAGFAVVAIGLPGTAYVFGLVAMGMAGATSLAVSRGLTVARAPSQS